MSPLRLAYLPASLEPGGAERQMLELAERLPRDRFIVEFVVISGRGRYDSRAIAAGANLRFIGATPSATLPLPARMARRAGKLIRLAQVVRQQRYDIVDAWLYPSDVLAALMRPFTKTPVVIAGRRNIDPQERFGPLERPVAALSSRLTDAVVANSAAVAQRAVDHDGVDPSKVRIIRNGVEPIPVLSREERASLRRGMDVSDDELLIGCVANYLPVKCHAQLIDAFSSLVAAGHRTKLLLVGEGVLRAALEQQIRTLGLERSIRLHGSVKDPRPLYGTFDLAVQASCREGLPNALLEAAAAGRAIVATDAGGSSEIVIDGETGLLVPVDDRAKLTEALRRAVTDAALRDRLGSAARDHAARAFGMDRFVREFAELYEELAERARRH